MGEFKETRMGRDIYYANDGEILELFGLYGPSDIIDRLNAIIAQERKDAIKEHHRSIYEKFKSAPHHHWRVYNSPHFGEKIEYIGPPINVTVNCTGCKCKERDDAAKEKIFIRVSRWLPEYLGRWSFFGGISECSEFVLTSTYTVDAICFDDIEKARTAKRLLEKAYPDFRFEIVSE